jgi:hypothetical protein
VRYHAVEDAVLEGRFSVSESKHGNGRGMAGEGVDVRSRLRVSSSS